MALACASRARGRGAIFSIFCRISAVFDPICRGPCPRITGRQPGQRAAVRASRPKKSGPRRKKSGQQRVGQRRQIDGQPVAHPGQRPAVRGAEILENTASRTASGSRYVLDRLQAAGRGMINWHSWRIRGPPAGIKKPPLGDQPSGGVWPPAGGVWPRT